MKDVGGADVPRAVASRRAPVKGGLLNLFRHMIPPVALQEGSSKHIDGRTTALAIQAETGPMNHEDRIITLFTGGAAPITSTQAPLPIWSRERGVSYSGKKSCGDFVHESTSQGHLVRHSGCLQQETVV